MNTSTIGTLNSPANSIATNRVLRNTYALLALTLYVAIYNLFTSLLYLLGASGGQE